MEAQKFATFITKMRKEKGMTQSDIAAKLNVTDKAVSRWERGLGFPDINTLEPLATILGVSILELMKSDICSVSEVQNSEVAESIENALDIAKEQRSQERNNFTYIPLAISFFMFELYFFQALKTLFRLADGNPPFQFSELINMLVLVPFFSIPFCFAFLMLNLFNKKKRPKLFKTLIFIFVIFAVLYFIDILILSIFIL